MRKFSVLVAVLLLVLGIASLASAAAPYVPIYTINNNFTMLDPTGAVAGGTNDVTFTWDGTLKTAVVASGQVSNATLGSPCPFTGFTWKAHDVAVYGPGTYTVKASCAPKAPACPTGSNPITFTVGPDEIGTHMLFDWGTVTTNKNIDVVNVWQMKSIFTPSALWTGACGSNASDTVWDLMSKNSGDGKNGYPMVDGGFVGFYANFNLMGAPINRVVDTANNNFTMDQPDSIAFGGTNDVRFTWDGTKRTSVATSGQVGNATVSSSCAFFGQPWWSHDMVIYGPGTYTVYTDCPAGSPGCGVTTNSPPYTFTVNAGEIGAHMLFLWNGNDNIDVVDVWKAGSFDQGVDAAVCTPAEFWTGACGTGDGAQVWDHMSYDWDNDCVNGAGMADGPFAGMNANFNVMGIALGETTKIGIFLSSGEWYLDKNGNGAWDGTSTDTYVPNFGFGVNGAIPAVVTNGTGTSMLGIYSSNALARWYVDQNGNYAWDGTPTDGFFTFGGLTGAVPVTGDWTGTGITRLGIYADGAWYLDINGNGIWDGTPTDALYNFGGGVAGAVPVTGDWTGTGITRIGIYADGAWYLDINGNGVWDGSPNDALYMFGGGIANAVPVTGDWNGSSTTKIGIFADGVWYLDSNGNGAWDSASTDTAYYFGGGVTGAVPVTGKW